jgi:hypothetical protein
VKYLRFAEYSQKVAINTNLKNLIFDTPMAEKN